MVKGIPALLDLGKSTQLSVDGAHAVVLGIAVTQRLVTFEGVSAVGWAEDECKLF